MKILTVMAVALGVLSISISGAAAAARKGGHFVGGRGPHHRGGHEVGGHVAHHPIRALIRRL